MLIIDVVPLALSSAGSCPNSGAAIQEGLRDGGKLAETTRGVCQDRLSELEEAMFRALENGEPGLLRGAAQYHAIVCTVPYCTLLGLPTGQLTWRILSSEVQVVAVFLPALSVPQ